KIKIRSAAFNPIDFQMRKGSSESKLLKSVILGREMSGIIVEVHPSVTGFNVEDEVYGYVSNLGSNGAYAEYIVVPATIIAHKPSNLDFNHAAAVSLVGLTSIQAIEKCKITNGNSVFITGGAGGVGSMIIRLLVQKGFNKIYTTAGNKESKQKIISYGLRSENIINYNDENIAEKLFTLNQNDKMDFCIDTVGKEMSDLCAEIIKINATYADIAFLTTESARELLFDKGVTIINISNYVYGIEGDNEKLKYYNNRLTLLKSYFENNLIPKTPVNIIGNLEVETVAKAHAILEKNETRGKKLIMEINN
ncbi:MAG: NADP-dependent oxidoreductase, partial [Rhizobacter sp.]|nr:NADP-dependent oxidoreductase [Ferruginibacter sp.]